MKSEAHKTALILADCYISAAINKKYGFICSAAILTHHKHKVKPLTAHEKP